MADEDPAKEKEEHLAEWLRRFKTAESIAPDVQRELELARWETRTRNVIVEGGVPREVIQGVDRKLWANLNDVRKSWPQMQDYGLPPRTLVSTSTASSTSEVITILFEMNGSSQASAAIEDYRQLQDRHGRFTDASLRLGAHFPGLVQMFGDAEEKFQMAKTGPAGIPDAATAMRTLLDKLKGELFSLAQTFPKENMTWAVMARRLAGTEERQAELLLEVDTTRGHLIEDLSGLLKQRTPLDLGALSSAWMRTVAHVFVVCGCLRQE